MTTMLARRDSKKDLANYETLRKRVREALILGQQRIEQQKVHTYWETGQLINQHILMHKERAGYGKQVILKLAKDLGVGDDLLYRVSRFAETFPISAGRRKLSWTHYRALVNIDNSERRLALAERADRLGWTSFELEEKVKRIVGDHREAKPKPLRPQLGKIGVYRLVHSEILKGKDKLLIDLGFSSFIELPAKEAAQLKEGDLVKTEGSRLIKFTGATEADLFTYKCFVERVIDGDTIWTRVDLGFGVWTRQKLRLRGIDAEEIETKAGLQAKKFLEGVLKKVPFVVLTTTKSDKFDRYLADIFVDGTYINQLLIDRGHASLFSI